MNRELALAIGINVNKTYTYTFALGAVLAGFSGALAIPSTAASVGMGTDILVEAFAIVAIGGLGSLKGALFGSIIAGVLRHLV
jgi:branched-chain amino acid transport system permease protein